jgi:hypothetical protein
MTQHVVALTCREITQPGADERRWELSIASFDDDEDHGIIDAFITATDAVKMPAIDDPTDWIIEQIKSYYLPDGLTDLSYVAQIQALSPLQIHPSA